VNIVLSIDQGTTGTTVVAVDSNGKIARKAYREIPQSFPKPGWVEHDPLAILDSLKACISEILKDGDLRPLAVGITNQRETALIWNRISGQPLCPAIVWQCRRTEEFCKSLTPHSKNIRDITGLLVDAYFSASKWRWMLEHHPEGQGEDWIAGTIDAWLIWNLTGEHLTDATNASRTQLLDLEKVSWSKDMADLFSIPISKLPTVRDSMSDYGTIRGLPGLDGVPILGVAGDQQAALFGQTCFDSGEVKNTYGTGAFLLMNTGSKRIHSEKGLISTLAVSRQGKACHALEGSVFICGAAIQWLRDGLGILENAPESEALAASLSDNEGVYFVPALVGLGAPHWNGDARGLITGLTRGTSRAHLVRAALEAMAFQSEDLLTSMENELGEKLNHIAVDGGACTNNLLMQFQADISCRNFHRPSQVESTALGAAFLAGLKAGFFESPETLKQQRRLDRSFSPDMAVAERSRLLKGWNHALQQTLA
jgi:glycerol kinase